MKKKILFLLAGILTAAFTVPARSQEIEKPKMVRIPGRNYEMMKTEVPQELYESVMGENPSNEKGKKNPVEMVSWFDAICFCNRLSAAHGYTPVYAVENETEPHKWEYIPHKAEIVHGTVTQNEIADGYRLPTIEEWEFAAKGGTEYKYAGSNNIDEVAWYSENSNYTTHEVATKKSNGYGLYDMSGNVAEWCWDSFTVPDLKLNGEYRYNCGGHNSNDAEYCEVNPKLGGPIEFRFFDTGFRLARTVRK